MGLTPVDQRIRHHVTQEAMGMLLAAVERQRLLLTEVRSRLAPPLDQHCQYVYAEKDRLTLVTDSPVWAARLRFLAPELMASLRGGHGNIKECRVRVQPPHLPTISSAKTHAVTKMPPKAAAMLLAAAEAQEGTELGRALRRLALAGMQAGGGGENPGEG